MTSAAASINCIGRPRMTKPGISSISPFFIVEDVVAAVAFYRNLLGFAVTFQEPAEDPFFAIVCRGAAMVFVKSVGAKPLPNCEREPQARWDAYLHVPDPDALAAEFASRGVVFSVPLKDTHDALRGFEVKDADGYVLFFGRPRTEPQRNLRYVAPVFCIADMARSLSYYRDVLGFEVEFEYEGFYAGIISDGCRIHLKCSPPPKQDRAAFEAAEHTDACVGVQNIESLASSFAGAGAAFSVPLREMPYGKEFYVRDPDGYILGFIQPAETA